MQYTDLIDQIIKREQSIWAIKPDSPYIKARFIRRLRRMITVIEVGTDQETDIFADQIWVCDFDPAEVRKWNGGDLIAWINDDENWDMAIGMGYQPIKLADIPQAKLVKDLTERYKRFGVKLDPEVVKQALQCGDPDQATTMLDYLTLVYDDVQIGDLESTTERKFSVFNLYDMIVMGRKRDACRELTSCLTESPALELLKTLSTLNRRQLIAFDAVNKGFGWDAVSEALGVKDWIAKQLVTKARRLDYGRVVGLHYILAQMDQSIKQRFRDAEQTLQNGVMLAAS